MAASKRFVAQLGRPDPIVPSALRRESARLSATRGRHKSTAVAARETESLGRREDA